MEQLLLSKALLKSHVCSGEYQRYGKEIHLQAGDFVYLPTDRLDTLFILNKGVVKLGSYSPKGAEVVYDIVCPGEFFGNLQYLQNNTFSEFAKALTPLEIYAYPMLLFKEIIRQDVDIAERFYRVMVRRWCRAETKLFANASLRPKERVQRLLQQYDRKVTTKHGDFVPINELLTQKDIADLTGLTRQTVAQIMKNATDRNVKAA
ncbi:MAG: Crp/Fnr family transcriptional regulator [Bacteroidota bacterium]